MWFGVAIALHMQYAVRHADRLRISEQLFVHLSWDLSVGLNGIV